MRAVAKHLELVQILARRHVAQREGLAHQGRLIRAKRMHVLNALGSKTALEQRGRDRRRADGFELAAGSVAKFGHGFSYSQVLSFRGAQSANPESRDSGFKASPCPGMTA